MRFIPTLSHTLFQHLLCNNFVIRCKLGYLSGKGVKRFKRDSSLASAICPLDHHSVIVPCGQQEGLYRSLTSSDVSRPHEKTSIQTFAGEKSDRNDPLRRGARRIRKRAPYADLVLGGEAYDAVARTYRGSNCVVRISIRGSGRDRAGVREGGVGREGRGTGWARGERDETSRARL